MIIKLGKQQNNWGKQLQVPANFGILQQEMKVKESDFTAETSLKE